jgi:hypothetical protein
LEREIQSKYNYRVARKAIELHDDRKRDDKVQQRLLMSNETIERQERLAVISLHESARQTRQ